MMELPIWLFVVLAVASSPVFILTIAVIGIAMVNGAEALLESKNERKERKNGRNDERAD